LDQNVSVINALLDWVVVSNICLMDRQRALVKMVSNMFIFIPLVGEMIQFDQYFSGGMKPPTTSSEYFG